MQRRAVGLLAIVLTAVVVASVSPTVFGQNDVPVVTDPDAAQPLEKLSWFDHFIKQGGPITWFILIPLSMAMVSLAIEQFFSIRRNKLMPPELQDRIQEMFEKKQFAEAQTVTNKDPSMLAAAINAGLQEAGQGAQAISRGVMESIETNATRLLRKIEYLNVIGNVSPMIGLFGTVYGMIQAFEQLRATQGVPDASKLAEGISVALVTTFWGLLIAIPALSVYAISRNRIDGTAAECALWTDELFTGFNPVPGSSTAEGQRTPFRPLGSAPAAQQRAAATPLTPPRQSPI